MFAWLKKYFISREEKESESHFFHRDTVIFSVIILVGLFLLIIAGSNYLIQNKYFGTIYPQVLVSYANETRQQVFGDGKLAVNSILEEAAKMKAEDMAKNGYFAHTSPSGKTPWYWLDQAGYNFKYAGENLAINFAASEDVQNAWMASPLHKENILNPKFTEIGIAIATGTYEGKEATFVVQFFGTPAVSEPPKGIVKVVTLQPSVKAESIEVSSTVAGASVVATSGFPYAKEGQVFAAYQEKTSPFWGNISTSPEAGVDRIYVIFIALVLALIFGAVLWELRRHRVSLWLNYSLLLLLAYALVTAAMYLQSGVPGVL